jgi:hypothetical protein
LIANLNAGIGRDGPTCAYAYCGPPPNVKRTFNAEHSTRPLIDEPERNHAQ